MSLPSKSGAVMMGSFIGDAHDIRCWETTDQTIVALKHAFGIAGGVPRSNRCTGRTAIASCMTSIGQAWRKTSIAPTQPP